MDIKVKYNGAYMFEVDSFTYFLASKNIREAIKRFLEEIEESIYKSIDKQIDSRE